MSRRGVAAALAGVAGAAAVHALDEAALLPGVHEAADVREAMTPLLMAGWLALAAALGLLSARTRPVPVGAGSAVVVAAIPELVGRHDAGAVAEPGALAGALLQWLVLLAVLALLVAADRLTPVLVRSTFHLGHSVLAVRPSGRVPGHLAVDQGRPRAPPCCVTVRSST